MVEVAAISTAEPRRDRFEDLPVQPHGVTAGAERKPVQVDPGTTGDAIVPSSRSEQRSVEEARHARFVLAWACLEPPTWPASGIFQSVFGVEAAS